MNQSRQFLADTVDLQSQFLVDRLSRSLPKMLNEADAGNRGKIRLNFESLLESSQGCYALVDMSISREKACSTPNAIRAKAGDCFRSSKK